MTWHVVCLAGPNDSYSPSTAPGDSVLLVPIQRAGDPENLQTSVPDILRAHGLSPTVAAIDLLHAAIAAYTGDVRVSRRSGYDDWTRDLVLHIAVLDQSGWTTSAEVLERLLSFLTGDHWRIVVHNAPDEFHSVDTQSADHPPGFRTNTVSLFSGGLDSFIGALDALAEMEKVLLVGHHAAGHGPTSSAQRRAIAALRESYSEDTAPFLKCWISPPKGLGRASETTTRGRSILFLALGIAVASGLQEARLLVPENGFISLNVPLTPPRSGSLSTRTTHPHLVELLRSLLGELGIAVNVELPYRFHTKGEMLNRCADQVTLAKGLEATMSCAHPGIGRFVRGGSPSQHCGYCVPCLVRRASIAVWGPDPTSYAWSDLRGPLSPSRGADLRALRLALERFGRQPPTLVDVLNAGPLPGSTQEREAYVDVFRRGLDELRGFLNSFA